VLQNRLEFLSKFIREDLFPQRVGKEHQQFMFIYIKGSQDQPFVIILIVFVVRKSNLFLTSFFD